MHLNQLQVMGRESPGRSGQAGLIRKACKGVAYKLQGRAGPTQEVSLRPGTKKYPWSERLIQLLLVTRLHRGFFWRSETEEQARSRGRQIQVQKDYERGVETHFEDTWMSSWRKYQDKQGINPTVRPRVHAALAKVKS